MSKFLENIRRDLLLDDFLSSTASIAQDDTYANMAIDDIVSKIKNDTLKSKAEICAYIDIKSGKIKNEQY